jgi:hypothetical protein
VLCQRLERTEAVKTIDLFEYCNFSCIHGMMLLGVTRKTNVVKVTRDEDEYLDSYQDEESPFLRQPDDRII